MIKYQLYCQICHYKHLFGDDEVKNLSLQKSSDIQGSIPKLNPLSKKIETQPIKKGKYKSKCPKCGRMIFVTRYNEPKQEDNPT